MKKEAKSYKILSFVSVLMFLCLIGFVYGGFDAVWDTPANGSTIALSDLVGDNYTFVINITESDSYINVTNVTIYRRVSGQDWTEWASNITYNITAYNITVPLTGSNALNGSFELMATVTTNNSVGSNGSNSSVINVYIDTIKPVVTLANATDVNSSSSTINYQYTATDYNLSTCEIWFGNSYNWTMLKSNTSINSGSITESITNESLVDGYYNFSVYCTDTLGNNLWNDTNVTFAVDTADPIINNISIINSIVRRGTFEVNITVNATDAFLGVKNVTVNNVSLTRASATSDIWSKLMNISSSPLNIIASDYVGRTDTNNTVEVTFDDVAPITTFTITETDGGTSTIDTTGAVWYNEDLRINLTAADAVSDISAIMYRNGTSGYWTVWDANLTFDTNLSNQTLNTFQFRANDTAGNVEGYQSKTVQIDQVAPTVTINSLSSTSIGIGGQNIIVAATITDTLSGLNTSKIKAYHNGTGGSTAAAQVDLSLLSGKYVGTLTAPTAAGSYVVTVNATDNAGNVGSTTSVFLVNSTGPAINANVANNTYVANQSTVIFNITGANVTAYSTLETPQLTFVNITSMTTPLTFSILINATSSTTFNISMQANHSGSNISNAAFIYLVDVNTPSIAFSSPAIGQLINGTIEIAATSNDAHSGTANVSFYVDGEFMSVDTTAPYTYNWNTLNENYANGNYTLNITASDYMGNTNTTSLHVILNNSMPNAYSVVSGVADFGETSLKNHIPQITGLNSTTAIVIIRFGAIIAPTSSLASTKFYLNITADTAETARVYFRLTTAQITSSDTDNIWVYMDHDENGLYEDSIQAQYIGLNGDYYDFYFTTTSFSIFAIGIKEPTTPSTGGSSTSGGGGGAKIIRIPLTMTANAFSLSIGDTGIIAFGGTDYNVKVSSLKTTTATVSVGSGTATLAAGESVNIDVDGDGTDDVNIKATRISSSKAYLEIRKLYVGAAPAAEPAAEPEAIAEPQPEPPVAEPTEPIEPTPPPEPAAVEPTNYAGWIIAIAVIIVGLIAALVVIKKKQQ